MYEKHSGNENSLLLEVAYIFKECIKNPESLFYV